MLVIGEHCYLKLLHSHEALHLRRPLRQTAASLKHCRCLRSPVPPPAPSSTCDGDSSVFRSLPPGDAEAPRCAAVFGNSRNVSTPLEPPTTTTILKVNGENMKNLFLIHTAKIKMWLMPSLNKDYAGASQRDECLNSFSLVALQWAQMSDCWWSSNPVSGACFEIDLLNQNLHIYNPFVP